MAQQIYKAKYFTDQGRYRFDGDQYEDDTPFNSGRIVTTDLQEGLSLHAMACTDLINTAASIDIAAGFYITVILDGDVNVAFEEEWLTLQTETFKKRSYVHGVIAHVPQAALFHREWKKGKSERKVSIYVSHAWLKQIFANDDHYDQVIQQLAHQTLLEWHPSKKSMLTVEHIMHGLDNCEDIKRIQLLSDALIIVHDALQTMFSVQGSRRIHSRYYDSMHQVTELLRNAPWAEATVDDIAQHMALSVSTLQRQFKSVFGVSVDEYRRRQRLDKAKRLLEEGTVNITHIASLCGYNSVANFSTAFRKNFGVSPKQIREKSS